MRVPLCLPVAGVRVCVRVPRRVREREGGKEGRERVVEKFEAKTSSLIFPKKFYENNFCSLEKFPFSAELFGSAL